MKKDSAYVVTNPQGKRFVYSPKTDRAYLNQLQKSFPGMEVTTENIVPGYVWSNPKGSGWSIQTVANKQALRIDEETWDELSSFVQSHYEDYDRDELIERMIGLFGVYPEVAMEVYDIVREDIERLGVSSMDVDHTEGKPGGSYEEILDSLVGSRKGDTDISFSKENIEKTVQNIVKSHDTKDLVRWIGLAGGKRNLLSTLERLKKSFSAEIPDEFYDLVDQASKEWRDVPTSHYLRKYPK